MPFTSVEYRDLVTMYCGRPAALPPELCIYCLEFAGLCGTGPTFADRRNSPLRTAAMILEF